MEVNWSLLFEKLRNAASGEITQEIAAPILRLAIDFRDGEWELLDKMREDGRRLTEAPFSVGIRLLTEACQPERTAKEWADSIQQARDKFIEAQQLEQMRGHYLRKALAEYRAGICCTVLGDGPDAEKFYQAAFTSGWMFIVESCNKFAADPVKRKRTNVGVGPITGLFRLIGYSMGKSAPANPDDSAELDRMEQIMAHFLRSLKLLEGPYKLVMDDIALIQIVSLYSDSPRRANFAGLINWGD